MNVELSGLDESKPTEWLVGGCVHIYMFTDLFIFEPTAEGGGKSEHGKIEDVRPILLPNAPVSCSAESP